jgi:hypothetical protein
MPDGEMNKAVNDWIRTQGGATPPQEAAEGDVGDEGVSEDAQRRSPDGRFAGPPPVSFDQGARGRGGLAAASDPKGKFNELVRSKVRERYL